MNVCMCNFDADSCDMPTIIETKMVQSRKNHNCCECSGEINLGNTYELVKGLWNGKWDTIKTCITCASIRKQYCSDGFIYGELCSLIWECYGFDYITNEYEEDR